MWAKQPKSLPVCIISRYSRYKLESAYVQARFYSFKSMLFILFEALWLLAACFVSCFYYTAAGVSAVWRQ